MTLTSIILDKMFAEAFEGLKAFLKKKNIELLRDEKIVREIVRDHINYITNWSCEVAFKDLDNPKSISEIYVKLDYYLNPIRDNLQDLKMKRVKLSAIFEESDKHIVILGQPGAGKTTTMKFICDSVFHDENFHPEYHFPVLIRLRDLSKDAFSNSDESLFDKLFSTLGLKIDEDNGLTSHYSYSSIRECVIRMVDSLGVLIVLDGFDEINPPEKKESIIKEFEYLCLHLDRSRVILTSRLGDYSYSIDNTIVYEISPLKREQIEMFAQKWLIQPEKYEMFLRQLRQSPFYDTAIRPLTMAHLCALYEKFGTIPDKPKNIYKKIVNLLIEEWDSQRMVLRQSSFVEFTTDRKAEFLAVLAFKLTTEIRKSSFTESEIGRVYKDICGDFSLRPKDQKNVLVELEGQTGLLLQSGYDSYEFAHKSLQEYLTAEYLVKLPVLPTDKELIKILPNELAVATSISSDPSMYFASLVINSFANVNRATIKIFLTRLIIEKPFFRKEALLAAATLYIRRLKEVRDSQDRLIGKLIENSTGLKDSLAILPQYYTFNSYNENLKDEEMELYVKKSWREFGIEAPLALQINRGLMKIIGIRTWK